MHAPLGNRQLPGWEAGIGTYDLEMMVVPDRDPVRYCGRDYFSSATIPCLYSPKMTVRTRFAPSPTGFLHIGGIRTALYCYALAHKLHGQFILRIEDTDQKRYVEGATDMILDMLAAYGIEPDESIRHGGEFGPYIQSERLELYKKYAEELVEKGAAYYCFLTEEESNDIKTQNKGTHKMFRSPYRDQDLAKSREMIAQGMPYVIRQKLPENRVIEYTDGVQGKMKFNTDDVDEGVLMKTDGYPTYHLAVVIDDHLMEISHVFRAAEWLPSTPKHVLLYEAFGWTLPEIFHLTAILDPDEGGKLSKRKGTVAARDFLVNGYLPEAILNFLMLLGWSSPEERVHGQEERELFSLTEFVSLFDPKDLNRSNPVFNREKLTWFNQKYIAGMQDEQLATRLVEWLEQYAEDLSDDRQAIMLAPHIKTDMQVGNFISKLTLVKERAKTLEELIDLLKFFYIAPTDIDWNIPQLERVTATRESIQTDIQQFMSGLDEDSTQWKHEDWEMGMRAIGDKHQAKHGDVFMILRIAIVGAPFSPPLFESLQLLGKAVIMERLHS